MSPTRIVKLFTGCVVSPALLVWISKKFPGGSKVVGPGTTLN